MLDPSIFQSGASTGAMAGSDVEALQKALTAGYGTDEATLAGGAALRVQSLDPVMQTTIQENKHFKLFNRLSKSKPNSTVDEWTEQNTVGGFLGGTTNSEVGVINQFTGNYQRMVGLVKFLMTRRQVSLVVTLQKAIADAESVEYSNGALQLLSDAEYLLFEGDDNVVPTEFSGIKAQLLAGVASGAVDPENIIDMGGKPLNSMIAINQASQQIRRYGNFGTATDIFFNQEVQADFDNNLDPAFRVALGSMGGAEGGLRLGAPVVGIRTSGGAIATNEDVFVRNDNMKQAFELMYPSFAAAQVGIQPSSVTSDGGATTSPLSTFTATRAGNYVYGVAGVNASGQSPVVLVAAVAVAAGRQVILTIARSPAAQETGYVIYRGRQNGPGGVADLREMCRIGVAGPQTTFADCNLCLPGSTEGYVLNLAPSATAITWRQLLPMLKWQLYPTDSPVIPWAQMLFGFLRISKRKHHVLIKNIVTSTQDWRPFTNE